MTFQEAKNLKIDDEVFIIGNDNKVYPKKVTGVQLRTGKQIDITFTNPTERNIGKGYVLSYQPVFLKEKDALGEVLRGYLSQKGDTELKIQDVRTQIRKLERKENRRQ